MSISRTGSTLSRWGNWSRGLILTVGQLSESQDKHLRLRVKQLICGSLNGMNQTVLDTAIHTLDRDAGPLEGVAAGSWSLGILEQSQCEGCCWLPRDTSRGCEGGDHGGEMSMEGSQKARQPWKQGDTPESCIGGGAITIACLSPHASICSWTIERVAHQMPHALNYRGGPHPGCPFKCLMRQSTK